MRRVDRARQGGSGRSEARAAVPETAKQSKGQGQGESGRSEASAAVSEAAKQGEGQGQGGSGRSEARAAVSEAAKQSEGQGQGESGRSEASAAMPEAAKRSKGQGRCWRIAKWIFLAVGFVASFFLLVNGFCARDRAGQMIQNPTILPAWPLSQEEAERLRTEEAWLEKPADFVLWQEEKDAVAGEGDAVSSARVKLLLLDGDGELLLPFGQRIPAVDTEGCLIDEETAKEIYGSVDVEGLALACGGRERVVRGVFPFPEKLVVMQAGKQPPESGWSRITLQRAGDGDRLSQAEDFLARNALQGELLRWDLRQGLSWLPELVPGKWSDFSGWGDNLDAKKQERQTLEELVKTAPELELARLQREFAVCLLLGGAILLILFIALRPHS